ncbi:MAG TPA: Ku protein [Pusillimonas sp.]|uniref:non-homologous end joining protein Ku n=1 Tax=Pusillimonas sp. TaxID=3040095 RepID=UPI002C415103|nr:Ku protein [Pusillimonas sp.]HUH88841.1 Ku protein [Pusillimonas sp.]
MPRVIWKGAITFGLVHVPIVLHAATRVTRLDFDWIDKRDNSPVGYQRINKRTGKPIEGEHIVKGYEYEKGEYVFLNDEDFKRANESATQSVDVFGFVKAAQVPLYYFDTPYYLAPDKRGDKGYALFREVLRKSGLLALAYVVLHTKQYLAALMPLDDVLMLVTLRYADEIRDTDDLNIPRDKQSLPAPRELQMAQRLLDEMTQPWDPAQYRDQYRDDLMSTIEEKIASGRTHSLDESSAAPRKSGKVIDLMAMLQRSIDERKGGGGKNAPATNQKTARKTARKATKKTTAKRASPSAKKTGSVGTKRKTA